MDKLSLKKKGKGVQSVQSNREVQVPPSSAVNKNIAHSNCYIDPLAALLGDLAKIGC